MENLNFKTDDNIINNYISEYNSDNYKHNQKILFKNIKKNIDNIYKYNLYESTNQNNLWIDTLKPYYENIIQHSLIEKLKLNEITKVYINYKETDDSPKFEDYKSHLENINEWKIHNGGFNNRNIEDILNIKVTPYKMLPIKNKKIISLSLFNVKFTNFSAKYDYNTTERKPPHFYTKVLNNAIDTYKKYMPDWIIRLYIDETIPMDNYENQPSLPNETKLILKRFLTEENMELISIKSTYLEDSKNKYKHLKLTPVIFRYLSFFDENVVSCFVADIDNTCTMLIAKLLDNFQKSNNKFIIFKPVKAYERTYFDGKCIDNFLAGMIGFNKEQDSILNYKIWQSLYKFFDLYYNDLKRDKKYENCTVKILVDSPFYYGFEENGFTTIFSYLINKFNLPVYLIPLYWDYGMDPSEMISYYILKNPLYAFTDKFIELLFNLMKINIDIKKTDELILLNSFKHAPIMIIMMNIIFYLHFNNIKTIINPENNEEIEIFKNKSLLDNILSVFPFVSGYTFDFKEVASDTSVCDIYGDEISTEIINIIDLFEKNKLLEFKNRINLLHKNIVLNINELAKINKSYIMYKENLSKNTDSILFDLEHPYSFTSIINNQYINYNFLQSISKKVMETSTTLDINELYFKPLNLNNIYNKTYDYVISLGDNFLNELLFINNLKKEYYPFELMVIDFDIFGDLIKTNFVHLLNLNNYVDYDKSITYQMDKTVSYNNYYQNLLLIDPRNYKINKFLMTTVKNFEKVKVNNDAKKLYVMHIDYENENENEKYNYYYLYEKINNISNIMKNMDILIMITSMRDVYKENVILNYEFENGNTLIIMHIYTVSNHTSSHYLDENDNININNIIKQIKLINKDSPNVVDYLKNKPLIINNLVRFRKNEKNINIISNFTEENVLKPEIVQKILKLFDISTQQLIANQNYNIDRLLINILNDKNIIFPDDYLFENDSYDNINYEEIKTILKNKINNNMIYKIMKILNNNIDLNIEDYTYYKIYDKQNPMKYFIDNNININLGQFGLVNANMLTFINIGSTSSVYLINDKVIKISLSTGKTYFNYYEYKNYKKILDSKDTYFKKFNVNIEDYIMKYYEHFYIDNINNRYFKYNNKNVYIDCLVMEKIDNTLFNGITNGLIERTYTRQLLNTLLRTLHIFHFNKLVHNDLTITNVGYNIKDGIVSFKIMDYGDMCTKKNMEYITCYRTTYGGWNNLLDLLMNNRLTLINDFDIYRGNDLYSLLLVLYDYNQLSTNNLKPNIEIYRRNINIYILNILTNPNYINDDIIDTLKNNLLAFNKKLFDFINNLADPYIIQIYNKLFENNGQNDLNELLMINQTAGNYYQKYLKYKQKYLELKNN
jgi:hypothetical protein